MSPYVFVTGNLGIRYLSPVLFAWRVVRCQAKSERRRRAGFATPSWMPDPVVMCASSNFNDPVDYSKSLLVKQAAARAKELVIERQIISIKHQIELSCHAEEEAVLEDNKQFARSDAYAVHSFSCLRSCTCKRYGANLLRNPSFATALQGPYKTVARAA